MLVDNYDAESCVKFTHTHGVQCRVGFLLHGELAFSRIRSNRTGSYKGIECHKGRSSRATIIYGS